MNTETLVQGSATIVTIVTLREHDVYKRLDKDYNGEKLVYGVVTGVMHNGTDTAITAIEFSTGYGTVEPRLKVWSSGEDLKLFAATPEEVRIHLSEVQDKAERQLQAAEDEVAKKAELLSVVVTVANHYSEHLTAAETTTAITA